MAADSVRYTELRPHQFRERMATRPLAYLPLGTLEWHGEHLPLGSDGTISEGLMIECAREYGGIVMPPIHLGPDRSKLEDDGSILQGMDYADSTTPHRQLDGSCYWVSNGFFMVLIDAILSQLKRAGFKSVFADGHGPSRNSWCQNLKDREARFDLKLFGVTEELRPVWKSQMDHASKNESSLVMAIRPELADLSRLDPDRSVRPQGVGGEDPRDATAEYGRECMRVSIDALKRVLGNAGI